jgi:hypothetical protein
MRLEVEDLIARAQSLGFLEILGRLVQPVGQRPRAATAGVEEPVLGTGGDQTAKVPKRRKGVAVLLGLADQRRMTGGIAIGASSVGIEPAELLEPLLPVPGRIPLCGLPGSPGTSHQSGARIGPPSSANRRRRASQVAKSNARLRPSASSS